MKLFYKIIIFLMVFQLSIIVVNALEIFPDNARLYSDNEMPSEIRNTNDTVAIFRYFLAPQNNSFGFGDMQWGTILGIFIGLGALVGIATHSIAPAVMIILTYSFVPMLSTSKQYFDKIFYFTDVSSVVYLGVIIFVGLSIIALITIVESATHGRSG